MQLLMSWADDKVCGCIWKRLCVCVWLTEAQPTLRCVWLRMNENHFTPAQYNPFSSDWLTESYRSVCFLSATPSPDTAAAQRSITVCHTCVLLCAWNTQTHGFCESKTMHRFPQVWNSHHLQAILYPTFIVSLYSVLYVKLFCFQLPIRLQ